MLPSPPAEQGTLCRPVLKVGSAMSRGFSAGPDANMSERSETIKINEDGGSSSVEIKDGRALRVYPPIASQMCVWFPHSSQKEPLF